MTAACYQIEVRVTSEYLPDKSQPEQNRYAFSYEVTLTNTGNQPAQLLNRYWLITNGNGQTQEVHGPGVVGQKPRLKPGEHYRYSSGTLLATEVGTMQGHYQMQADDGTQFDAPIAPFLLAVPGVLH